MRYHSVADNMGLSSFV